jgi:GT2 family glycosyltransferase
MSAVQHMTSSESSVEARIVEAAGSNRNAGRESLGAPELSIIFVNWNSLEYLLDCIASVYLYTPQVSFEIIVVDNASPEGGIEIVEDKFPLAKLVRCSKNVGFAAANNIGFISAIGQYILLLNPDTKLIGPAIEIMLEQLKALPDAGIVGCKLLNTDLSISTSSIQKFPTILNQLVNVESLRLRYPGCPVWNIAPLFSESSTPVKVDVIPGACMMLRREVFEGAGMLSEDYFMYAEDIDLNYKVRKLGYASYYIGQGQIVHHGGRSSSRQQVSQWSTIMTHRAMFRFYRKSRGNVYGVGYRMAMGIAASVRLVLLSIMYPFGGRLGIRWALAKWRTILMWSIGVHRLGAGK